MIVINGTSFNKCEEKPTEEFENYTVGVIGTETCHKPDLVTVGKPETRNNKLNSSFDRELEIDLNLEV